MRFFGRAAARVAVACLGLAACGAPLAVLNDSVPTGRLVVVRDIPYGPGPLAGNPERRLDVYRPAAAGAKLPVVVFVYGGTWQYGERADYRFAAAPLAAHGVIVAVPDYRKYPEVQYPDFLRDVAQAVAFVQRSAESWGGDPHRVFVLGHSAGAYIAAMLALDPEWLAAAGLDRDAIAGTIGLSGPYDFLPITRPDVRAVFAPAAADLRATQPISYVDGHNRPMLLLTGADDTTVEPRNTQALAQRIRSLGGPVEVRTYADIGHIGTVLALAPLFSGRAPVRQDVLGFVNDPANATR